MEELTHLLRKARESQIHILLGYASWTAYAVDVFGGMNLRLSAGSRREVVALMDELDMSQRAIAAAIGVSVRHPDRVSRRMTHPRNRSIRADRTIWRPSQVSHLTHLPKCPERRTRSPTGGDDQACWPPIGHVR
jgi:hypothetical protein